MFVYYCKLYDCPKPLNKYLFKHPYRERAVDIVIIINTEGWDS